MLFLLATACSNGDPGSAGLGDPVVSFPPSDATLRVRIADSDDERRRGLMDVRELPADQGMAFVWDEPVDGTFWMKDTLIPLSIAFVAEDGRIVTIRDMEPCSSDPCPRYSSAGPYVMAIEANQGYFDGVGVTEGDLATLEASDA